MDITMAQVARDFESDGIPASGKHKIKKPDLRKWGKWVEDIITAFTSNGGLIYSTKAAMDADLAHGANSMAWVVDDPVAANNGVYGKVGASGTGSWARRADLPFSFIIASDAGAGTPNAIQATTSIPVSESALIWMNIFEANTASPVTVSFNGDAALTIKTNSGNDVAAGGLVAGMIVLGIVSGTTFRLVSDQVSSAIVAAAEAFAADAAASAAAAQGIGFPVAIWPSSVTRTMIERSKYQCHISEFDVDPTGTNDSTAGIKEWLEQAETAKVLAKAGCGRFVLQETLSLPAQMAIEGEFSSAWHAVGRNRTVSPFSAVDLDFGTIFYCVGGGFTAVSTNRADTQNKKVAIHIPAGGTGVRLAAFKIVAAFDRESAPGVPTTRWNDNHADIDIGVLFRDGTDYGIRDLTVGGYWQHGGVIFDGSGVAGDPGVPAVGGIEKVSVANLTTQGMWGLRIQGGDTSAEGVFGMSNFAFNRGMLFSYDHHGAGFSMTEREAMVPNSGALFIDGLAGASGEARINHPSFTDIDLFSRDHYLGYVTNCWNPEFKGVRGEARPFYLDPVTVKNVQFSNCELPYATGSGVQHALVAAKGSGYTTATVTPSTGGGTYTPTIVAGEITEITVAAAGTANGPVTLTITGDGSGAQAVALPYYLYREAAKTPAQIASPRLEKMGREILVRAKFCLEFQAPGGVVQHRIGVPIGGQGVTQAVRDIWKLAIDAGWDPTAWTNTTVLTTGETAEFSKGLSVGPDSTVGKYTIYTSLGVQNDNMGAVEADVRIGRAAMQTHVGIVAEARRYVAPAATGRFAAWSTALEIDLRRDSGVNTADLNNLVQAQSPGIQIYVDGWFLSQIHQ